MRYVSLFSGIEAASQAWAPLGWGCAAVSEIEPFPCAVLAHHYPGIPNLGDVTQITEVDIMALGPIDLVVFGSPCQDLSVAGNRKGLTNADGTITRSGLFFTAINVFHWARKHCGARFALWENVPGAFSSGKGRDFASVVSFMAGLDDVDVPPNGWGTEGAALGDHGLLEWSILDAQFMGLAQRRRRVFALLDTGDWASRPPILLEPESLRGDTAPRRETGQVAPTIPSRSLGGGGLGTGFDCDGGLIADTAHALRGEGFDASEDGTGRGTPLVPVVAATRAQCYGKNGGIPAGKDCVPTNLIPVGITLHGTDGCAKVASYDELAQCLRARTPGNIDNSSTTGVQHPVAASFKGGQGAKAGGIGYDEHIAPTLSSADSGSNRVPVVMTNITANTVAYSIITANTGANGLGVTRELSATLDRAQPHAVAFLPINKGRPNGRQSAHTEMVSVEVGTTPTLTTDGHQRSAVAYALQGNMIGRHAAAGPAGSGFGEEVCFTQTKTDVHAAAFAVPLRGREGDQTLHIRRLVVEECEALQGFPRGHTNVPYRNKPAADGPRYKALGNSMAVPVMRWIGLRVQRAVGLQGLLS